MTLYKLMHGKLIHGKLIHGKLIHGKLLHGKPIHDNFYNQFLALPLLFLKISPLVVAVLTS